MKMPNTKSVLLVDDSKFARLLVKAFISSNFANWEIDEAEDGAKALEMVDAKTYDYMLVDFNMPGMDGLELGELLGLLDGDDTGGSVVNVCTPP